VVVDLRSGATVGRLPWRGGEGAFGFSGWRSLSTVWVEAEDPSGTCVAAFSASAPAWAFGPDSCHDRPPDAGPGFTYAEVPSPDGHLTAETTERRGWREIVQDVRLEGRRLAQLGEVTLVGWGVDGSLVVRGGRFDRAYRIPPHEVAELAEP
jgi:hypothetical protein